MHAYNCIYMQAKESNRKLLQSKHVAHNPK